MSASGKKELKSHRDIYNFADVPFEWLGEFMKYFG